MTHGDGEHMSRFIDGKPLTHMPPPIFLLQQVDLFRALSLDKLHSLVAPAVLSRRYEKQEFVVHKGDAGTDLLLLLQGRLQVVDITSTGQEVGLHIIEPVSYFGELSVIDDMPRSASIRAMEASIVGSIAKETFLQLMHQEPVISLALMKRLAAIIRSNNQHRAVLSIHNVQRRLIALLLETAKPADGESLAIRNLPTQQEMAAMISTTRESVSRALSLLHAQNLIKKQGRVLILVRPGDLKKKLEEN